MGRKFLPGNMRFLRFCSRKPKEAPSPRKRRCFLVRILLLLPWLLLLPAFVGGYRYLQSELFQSALKERLLPYASRALSADVQCRNLNLDLFTGRITVDGLTIIKKEKSPLPLVEAEKIEVAFQWDLPWRDKRLTLGSVTLKKPVLRLDLLGDSHGTRPPATQPGGAMRWIDTLFRASFRSIEIQNGLLILQEMHIPLEMTLDDISVVMAQSGGPGYQGDVRFRQGRIKARNWQEEDLEFFAVIEFLPQAVHFRKGRIHNPSVDARFEGQLGFQQALSLEVDYTVAGSAAHMQKSFHSDAGFQGDLQASGHLVWNRDHFQTAGKFTSPEMKFQNLTVHDSQGDFVVRRDGLELRSIHSKAFGGDADGNFTIDWGAMGTNGKGEFQIRSIPFQPAIRSVIPLNWPSRSRIDGNILFAWEGEVRSWHLALQADLSAPGRNRAESAGTDAAASLLNPAGHIDMEYRQGLLHFRQLDITFPAASHARIAGTAGIRSLSDLTIDFHSTDLPESLQLIRILSSQKIRLDGSAWLPESMHSLDFHGRLHGSLLQPEVEGDLICARPVWKRSGWDSFSGNLHWNLKGLSVRDMSVTGPSGQARAELSMQFATRDTPFSLNLRGRTDGLDANILSRALTPEPPLHGKLEADFELEYDSEMWSGRADSRLIGTTVQGMSLGNLAAVLRWQDKRIGCELVSDPKGPVPFSAKGWFDVEAERYSLQGRAENLPVDQISFIKDSKNSVSGSVDLTLEGEGTLSDQSLHGTLQSSGLRIFEHPIQELASRFQWDGKTLRWSGSGSMNKGKLSWDANIPRTFETDLWHMDLTLQSFDLFGLLSHSTEKAAFDLRSLMSGKIRISGLPAKPEEWQAQITLPDTSVYYQTLELRAAKPLQAVYRNGRLQLEPADFSIQGNHLTIGGSYDTREQKSPFNFRISSQLDLTAFKPLLEDVDLNGKATVEIDLQGSASSPRFRGVCRLENVGLGVSSVDYSIGQLGGEVVFDGNLLRAHNLKGSFAGGMLVANGTVQWDQANLTNFLWNFHLDKVQLRIPQGFHTVSNADLIWRGNRSKQNLTGEIRVAEAEYNRNIDFFRDLGKLMPSSSLADQKKRKLLDPLALDLQIRFLNGMEIRTDTLRLMADGNLRLLGPAFHPSLLGRISASSGELSFLGNNYEITKGGVEFVNPLHIEPLFDLSAVTTVHGYRINLQLVGRPDNIKPEMRSEPSLPMLDLLTLLSTGVTSEELLGRAAQGGNVGMAASSLLAQGLSQQVESRMQRLLGFRQFRIDPYLSSRSNNPTARVTLERRISQNLSLTYSTDLTDANQQIVLIEYFFSPDYSLIASRDEDGDYGLDLRIQRRF